MLTLLIIFIAIAASGFAFWFYNRKQITNLSEQIDDKNAVINALKGHVENVIEIESSYTRNPSNDGWRGETTVNLTPTVEESLQQKPKNNNHNFGDKKRKKETNFKSDNPSRPKPKKKKSSE